MQAEITHNNHMVALIQTHPKEEGLSKHMLHVQGGRTMFRQTFEAEPQNLVHENGGHGGLVHPLEKSRVLGF